MQPKHTCFTACISSALTALLPSLNRWRRPCMQPLLGKAVLISHASARAQGAWGANSVAPSTCVQPILSPKTPHQ